MATKAEALSTPASAVEQQEREVVFDIFRRWGYLQASLDPLGTVSAAGAVSDACA